MLFLFVVSLLPAVAWAQTSGCFRQAELKAEANVRLGLLLRERAAVCAVRSGDPAFSDLPERWSKFEQANASQLKDAVETRSRAIERVFKNADNSVEAQTGRLIARFREEPAYSANCRDIQKLLDGFEKSGWGGFQKRARLFDSEVKLDSPPC
jgi:hypothetical protein